MVLFLSFWLQEILILLIIQYSTFPKASKFLLMPRTVHISQNETVIRTTSFISRYRCGGNKMEFDTSNNASTILVIVGSPSHLQNVDGCYKPAGRDTSGRSHYVRFKADDMKTVHLVSRHNRWIFEETVNTSREFISSIASLDLDLNKVSSAEEYVNIRYGSNGCDSYKVNVELFSGRSALANAEKKLLDSKLARQPLSRKILKYSNLPSDTNSIRFGIPQDLLPYYISFLFEAIATGLSMPLLPYFVMELGATAFHLSVVVSLTYFAQMIGCLVMGRVSDLYGRRTVMLLYLLASTMSYINMSRAKSVSQVILARIIAASFGGLLPVMQSAVADISNEIDRPKYLGRITATFGLGFVFGPLLSTFLSAVCPTLSTRDKILIAAVLPLSGLLVAAVFSKETKQDAKQIWKGWRGKVKQLSIEKPEEITSIIGMSSTAVAQSPPAKISAKVVLLVLSGFLGMFAFSTESIYAVFAKDCFGFEEQAMSALLAGTGLFIGLFQVFLIRPLIGILGKYSTLLCGDFVLTLGMLGIGLVRTPLALHISMFVAHVVGFAVADTALTSLIIRYSNPQSQGRDLALNQAAQSCAKILSPLAAGYLYGQRNSGPGWLPLGSGPFLLGAVSSTLALITLLTLDLPEIKVGNTNPLV